MPLSIFFQNFRWPSIEVVTMKSVLRRLIRVSLVRLWRGNGPGHDDKVDDVSVHEALVVLVCGGEVLQEDLFMREY